MKVLKFACSLLALLCAFATTGYAQNNSYEVALPYIQNGKFHPAGAKIHLRSLQPADSITIGTRTLILYREEKKWDRPAKLYVMEVPSSARISADEVNTWLAQEQLEHEKLSRAYDDIQEQLKPVREKFKPLAEKADDILARQYRYRELLGK
ncbi:MAG: hypothetical protein WAX89_04925 [Alphaproteobacteria bacterium]